MGMNEDNKTRIDRYIESNPDAKTGEHFPISLKGKKQSLDVYRLPTNMLFYNIKNGRFAAEYNEKVRREGGHLDAEKEEDAEVIKNLLLSIAEGETKRTYSDLKIRGQWNCGIITIDGYLIDGNRRKAIISQLYEDTGQEVWKYMEVARLDGPITPESLWALEAGIQLGKDEIVRYGPINEMLKIREGKRAGLSEKEIVNALYGYDREEEIHDKIDRLELIGKYLEFVGRADQYSLVKNNVEHFINLQKIMKSCDEQGYEPDKKLKIKYATFQLIREGATHLEIRKINQMIDKDLTEAVYEIESAGELLTHRTSKTSNDDLLYKEVKAATDEFDTDAPPTQTRTQFINATDILDVSNAEGEGVRLLHRAEANLRAFLDYQGDVLSQQGALELIEKIKSHAKQISDRFGGPRDAS